MSWGHLSISAISQLLLAQFGSNFKQRVLGTYTTDYNCHHNIYPGNICPAISQLSKLNTFDFSLVVDYFCIFKIRPFKILEIFESIKTQILFLNPNSQMSQSSENMAYFLFPLVIYAQVFRCMSISSNRFVTLSVSQSVTIIVKTDLWLIQT